MEEKLIKVLWVENDPEVIGAFPGEAYEYGIHLVPFTNWDDESRRSKRISSSGPPSFWMQNVVFMQTALTMQRCFLRMFRMLLPCFAEVESLSPGMCFQDRRKIISKI